MSSSQRIRRIVALLIVTLSLIGAQALSAQAEGNPVVASVTGSGDFILGGELTTFAYSAILRADGTVSGQYQYNLRALNVHIHGPVTCLVVDGNRGWIGGIAAQIVSDNPNLVALTGQDSWFQVLDNGQGSNDPPDVTTSLGVTPLTGPPGEAQDYCDRAPDMITARTIVHGNINVRDSQ
ncbi:MAG: hypothetical protein ACRD1H_09810 [Vicinamibacterales bacterium]